MSPERMGRVGQTAVQDFDRLVGVSLVAGCRSVETGPGRASRAAGQLPGRRLAGPQGERLGHPKGRLRAGPTLGEAPTDRSDGALGPRPFRSDGYRPRPLCGTLPLSDMVDAIDEKPKTSIVLTNSKIIRQAKLTREDAERVQRLAEDTRARATRRAYAADWAGFEAWCSAREGDPQVSTPLTVVSYLAWMADEGSPYASIARAASGITGVLEEIDPGAWRPRPPELRKALENLARRLGVAPTRQKRPLTLDLLTRGVDAAYPGTTLRELRARALLLFGFYLASRRAEVTALTFSTLSTADPRGILVTIPRSKTDQRGEGFVKFVYKQPDHCPVFALKRWVAAAGLVRNGVGTGLVFREIGAGGTILESGVHPIMVARAVKEIVTAIGLNPAPYGGHSLRAGFITDAASRGIGLEEIAHQSGHKSLEQLRKYIRRTTAAENNATDGFVLRGKR